MSVTASSVKAPPTDVYVITFVLELPVDLRLPDMSGVLALTEDDGRFAGWPREAIAAAVGGDPFNVPEGKRPSTRIVLRRLETRTSLPLEAADRMFGAWAGRLMTRRGQLRRRANLHRYSRRGMRVMRTVAALSRYIGADQLPDSREGELRLAREKELLYGQEFDAGLADLNDLLVALGLSGHELSIGPIHIGDLPAMVPVIVERIGRGEGDRRVGWSELHHLHFQWPDIAPGEREPEVIRDAVAIFNDIQTVGEPLLPFFELWRRSEVDDAAGRHSQAILALGTAIEVLVSTLIREIGSRRGVNVDKILGPNGPGLKNLVVDHLPKYVGAPISMGDLEDRGHAVGWWWIDGYELRNRVAHQGERADGGDVEEAVMAARHLIEWLGEQITKQADVSDLGNRPFMVGAAGAGS